MTNSGEEFLEGIPVTGHLMPTGHHTPGTRGDQPLMRQDDADSDSNSSANDEPGLEGAIEIARVEIADGDDEVGPIDVSKTVITPQILQDMVDFCRPAHELEFAIPGRPIVLRNVPRFTAATIRNMVALKMRAEQCGVKLTAHFFEEASTFSKVLDLPDTYYANAVPKFVYNGPSKTHKWMD
ncbi:unnamed protein product [Arabidopsis arenosa]|uniref:Uncharacterized protein n=1 Tax=Arabidopsis arenosa TaxID=38785 RepID=A0A8S1ZMX7_ARAAE|nr:unnamed protein product [Arabidopsis arenosa]